MPLPDEGQMSWSDELNDYLVGAAVEAAAIATADAETAAAEAEAFGGTNDTIIAGVLNTPASATAQKLATSSVGSVVQPGVFLKAGSLVLSPSGEIVRRKADGTTPPVYDPIDYDVISGATDIENLGTAAALALTDNFFVSQSGTPRKVPFGVVSPIQEGMWMRSGVYNGPNASTSSQTSAMILNSVYLGRWRFRKGGTANELRIRVFAAGGAGSVVRLGLFSLDPTTLVCTLLTDFGTVDTSTTGVKSLTISRALSDNTVYVVGAVAQVGTSPTVYSTTTRLDPHLPANGGPDVPAISLVATGITGAFPATLTPAAGAGSFYPAIVMKAA